MTNTCTHFNHATGKVYKVVVHGCVIAERQAHFALQCTLKKISLCSEQHLQNTDVNGGFESSQNAFTFAKALRPSFSVWSSGGARCSNVNFKLFTDAATGCSRGGKLGAGPFTGSVMRVQRGKLINTRFPGPRARLQT